MANDKLPKVGQEIYVRSSCSISHGSDDVVGGLAKITKVEISKKLPKDHINSIFISVKEHPGHSYNYKTLMEEQAKLKKEFGKKRAYPDPDIDRPWIEDGDTVNGVVYHGPPIW